MVPESPYFFTYGTLMSSFENPFSEKLRSNSSFIGRGTFTGKLYRISWYPGAVFNVLEKTKVYGEIYRLHAQEIWKELDEYEDVLEDENASLYVRKIIPVTLESGGEIACWTYLYNQPVEFLEQIKDGIFKS
ncbi:gamma-glutamylcyclotransferase family protein [Dyadobacter luticola]|uniref:Gamma-glutamylcyclotransferase n=1 Tax=Dyadobacter luticola TaxID=1979387 RepID=A0A5R9KVF5_9BACT|nr:gamma-glutamylcyclotransferase family protein [Dyadobacter luticola]TLV00253.1 gamma-glutamylcyclotransferase [Dyadobacter luticola]